MPITVKHRPTPMVLMPAWFQAGQGRAEAENARRATRQHMLEQQIAARFAMQQQQNALAQKMAAQQWAAQQDILDQRLAARAAGRKETLAARQKIVNQQIAAQQNAIDQQNKNALARIQEQAKIHAKQQAEAEAAAKRRIDYELSAKQKALQTQLDNAQSEIDLQLQRGEIDEQTHQRLADEIQARRYGIQPVQRPQEQPTPQEILQQRRVTTENGDTYLLDGNGNLKADPIQLAREKADITAQAKIETAAEAAKIKAEAAKEKEAKRQYQQRKDAADLATKLMGLTRGEDATPLYPTYEEAYKAAEEKLGLSTQPAEPVPAATQAPAPDTSPAARALALATPGVTPIGPKGTPFPEGKPLPMKRIQTKMAELQNDPTAIGTWLESSEGIAAERGLSNDERDSLVETLIELGVIHK